jgi:hypothetical protein
MVDGRLEDLALATEGFGPGAILRGTPDAPGLNISRQIRDEGVRADLEALAQAAAWPAPAPTSG